MATSGWKHLGSLVDGLRRSDARFCLAGEFVAQFKFTVLLMPNGPMRITSGPFEPELYKSEFEVQDGELKVGLKTTWWGGG